MSFDNFYPNRKDKRKKYYKAKAIDRTCRNHGSCSYCQSNRLFNRNEVSLEEELKICNALTYIDTLEDQ
jgi:hypothetical protein